MVNVHFTTTQFNPELFCGQEFYVPFGAQCMRREEVNIVQIRNHGELDDYLSRWVEHGVFADNYCSETNSYVQHHAQLDQVLDRNTILIAE